MEGRKGGQAVHGSEFQQMALKELQAKAIEKGVPKSGSKSVLLARLRARALADKDDISMDVDMAVPPIIYNPVSMPTTQPKNATSLPLPPGVHKTTLIVCPKSLLSNWEEQIGLTKIVGVSV